MNAAIQTSSDVLPPVQTRPEIEAVGNALSVLAGMEPNLGPEQARRVRKLYALALSVALTGLDIETEVEPISGGILVAIPGFSESRFAVRIEELDCHARAHLAECLHRPELHPGFSVT